VVETAPADKRFTLTARCEILEDIGADRADELLENFLEFWHRIVDAEFFELVY